MFAKTYPIIERALLPDVEAKKGRPEVRGRIKASDLEQVAKHEQLELAAHHQPGIEIMEVVADDGSVTYQAVTGPNCIHSCAACRGEIAEEMREFGKGAIGVFGDSSGGEMERLRETMRQFAEEMNLTLQAAVAARKNAELPPANTPAPELPASEEDTSEQG